MHAKHSTLDIWKDANFEVLDVDAWDADIKDFLFELLGTYNVVLEVEAEVEVYEEISLFDFV